MLRRGPVLANYYLYRCSASACATRIQVSHYATNTPPNKEKDKENKEKEKQKQQPPKQVKDTPKTAPTSAPTTTKPPPTKTPKPIKTNPNLPSPHTASLYENIHPVYEYSKTKEDRVLGIEDLVGHVSKSYNNDKFKDTEKVGDVKKVVANLKEKKFSLYGVFDGHQGTFAAEYVKERLPYELVATPEFATGDYEAAIKKAYASVHKALLASKAYVPEQPKYDFTSGTTASIALITPTTTYLAQLGNTPILVKKNKAKLPSTLFPLPQPDDLERLANSNMFLMYNYAPISEPKAKKESWDEITKAKGDYLHGVSNINTLGSLGDSMYEPANLNRYLDAMRAFHAAEPQRKLAEPKVKPGKATQTNFMELSNAFVKFARKSDAFKAIANHVAIADSRDDISWITNGFVDGTFKIPENVKTCSLRREPQVTSIPNEELKYVTIVTDGILLRQFQSDVRAMKDINRIVETEGGKSRAVVGASFHEWFFGDNYLDDLSSVIISYQK